MLSRDQLRRNVIFHTIDGVTFWAAVALFSREVVMPAMITDLGGSDLLIGLVPLIYWSGYVLPQLLSAKVTEGLGYKKPAVLAITVFTRGALLGCWLAMPALWGGPALLVVFFSTLALSSIGTGLVMPVWSDWFAKTAPEHGWGRLLGLRTTLAGVLALPLGWFSGWTMTHHGPPARYVILLGGALVFYALSFLSLLGIREERTEGLPDHRALSLAGYARSLGRILSERRDFRAFIGASLLISVPIILLSTYLTRYGLGFPGVKDSVTGTFTAAYFFSMAAGSLVGGRMSDRVHAMAPFRVFPLALAVAAACAVLARTPGMVTVAFCFLGLALGAQAAAAGPAVYRFAGPQRRPSFSAVYFSLLGVSYALSPVVAGALLDRGVLSFPVMFGLSGALALAGWAAFAFIRPPLAAAIPNTGPAGAGTRPARGRGD
jgi:MFS family permease